MTLSGLHRKLHSVFMAGLVFFLVLMIMGVVDAGAVDSGSDGGSYLSPVATDQGVQEPEDEAWIDEQWEGEWGEAAPALADPLEPINRFFFHFNDKLYYWVLKPIAKAYSAVIPEELQVGIRNLFNNLRTPARAVNSLLQGNVKDSGTEVTRFVLNSTVGILGLGDFARDVLGLQSSYEDLGQTFAHYGAGGVFYINWPFLGPSNLRDSIGLVGDAYLHPFFWLDAEDRLIISAGIVERINYTALTLGDYELFTQTALDPYAAVKDAYQQHRAGLIENK